MFDFFTELKMFELNFQEWVWGYKAYIMPAPFVLLALLYIYKHYNQKERVTGKQLIQWFVLLSLFGFVWLKTLYAFSLSGKALRAYYLFSQDSLAYALMKSMLFNFALCVGAFLDLVIRWVFVRCVQERQVTFGTFFDEQVRLVSLHRVIWSIVGMNFFFYATSQGWI